MKNPLQIIKNNIIRDIINQNDTDKKLFYKRWKKINKIIIVYL